MQHQSGSAEWGAAIIGQRRAHREAIPAQRLGLRIGPALQGLLNGADPAHVLFQLRLGVAVRLVDRLGGFPQVVELTELVGDPRQHPGDGPPDRVLAIGNDAPDRHGQGRAHFGDERGDGLLGGAQQAAGQQDLPGEAVAQHPQHLVANIRLQAIEGQDDLALLLEPCRQPGAVCQVQRHQLLVAPQLLGHRALGDQHPPRHQVLMDLRHAAVLSIAQRPDVGDDIQAELAMRQGIAALRLRAVRFPVARTRRSLAATDRKGQAHQSGQRMHGAVIVVGHP